MCSRKRTRAIAALPVVANTFVMHAMGKRTPRQLKMQSTRRLQRTRCFLGRRVVHSGTPASGVPPGRLRIQIVQGFDFSPNSDSIICRNSGSGFVRRASMMAAASEPTT